MRRLLSLILALTLLCGDAWAVTRGQLVSMVAPLPASPGYLPNCYSAFNIENQVIQSQALATSPWAVSSNAGSVTVTNNAIAAPDGTTTATSIVLPAVSGAGAQAVVYQTITTYTDFYSASVYVKGAVGGERISLIMTDGVSTFNSVQITAATSWQRFYLPPFASNGGANVEIGVNLNDLAESATSAQTVYVWGVQRSSGPDRQRYLPTTTTAVTGTTNEDCPAGVKFRDFSMLVPYGGNPIVPQNTASYNAWGTSDPYMTPNVRIGSTYYAIANCSPITGNRSTAWTNLCLYTGPSPVNWTNYAAGNPILTAGTLDNHWLLHAVISPSCSVAAYCAYYFAMTAGGNRQIFMASSNDLTTWTKYGTTPIITLTNPGEPFVIEIDGVLNLYEFGDFFQNYRFTSPKGDGVNWTYQSIVMRTGAGWAAGKGGFDPGIMQNTKHGFYEWGWTQYPNAGGPQQIGYSVSKDGKRWYGTLNPIMVQYSRAYPSGGDIGDAILFTQNGQFYLIFNYDNGINESQGMATYMPDQ